MKIRLMSSKKEWILLVIFYLLLLQNPLGELLPVFNLIDECLVLVGPVLWLYRIIRRGKITAKKTNLKVIGALVIFLGFGLLGNILYGFQIASAVVEDVYVNLKFFLAILTGYELFRLCKQEKCKRAFLSQARIAAVVFFSLFLLDMLFGIFKEFGIRYGIRVIKLMYGHPTYLASSMGFLLAVLTVFYEKKNDKYLFMTCAVLFFTLRGKAIAGVAVYLLIFFFVLKPRKRLRVWHFVMIIVAALVIAWEQFSYYYIDLGGASARSALLMTSIQIARDYFPIGTGFGTFASSVASEYYSPVYHMYGINAIHGMEEGRVLFGSDTFWPIIIGQAGVIGLACYGYVLFALFRRVLKLKNIDLYAYSGGVFIFAYMLISSTSESTFCNALSIPLALILGIIYAIRTLSADSSEGRRIKEHG